MKAAEPGVLSASAQELSIQFPRQNGHILDQDEEWCEVRLNGSRRRIRFHDYDEVYSIPGLYEALFYDQLKCTSPVTIRKLLAEQLETEGFDPRDLVVIDVGAGNGMVGEELARMGAGALVGVDIIEEAAMAAERDRPGVYEDYHVVDLTAIPDDVRAEMAARGFNALTTVAALGYGDMPPKAFAEAYNFVAQEGWIAFNIKEDFLDDGSDGTGFSRLIRRMIEEGLLDVRTQQRYRHRLSVSGKPLHYIGIVARKRGDVPADWVD